MDYSPQQYQKIFTLCSIINMEDITVATTILQQYSWNLQRAVQEMGNQNFNKQNPTALDFTDSKPKQEQLVFNNQEFDDGQFEDFQYEYTYNQLQQKKQMFDQQYVSFPLKKTTSNTTPDSLQRGLSNDRQLSLQQKHHRTAYHTKIAKNAEILYNRILESHPKQKRKIYENNKKINNNQKFIAHLEKQIKPKINFTFGTFLLNLVRSYLQKKFLLVYIHKERGAELEQKIESSSSIAVGSNKVAQMILTQKQIASFVNKNCVVYGMFDNADDYEVIQKYVPMSDVPAFALFSLDKKKQCQKYMSHYTLVRKSTENFLQWLAKQIGVPIKKKTEVSKQKIIENQEKKQQPKYEVKISDIVNEQNFQYQEMEKMYQLRRQKSKLQKQNILQFKEKIEALKKKFEKEPQNQSGKTIQFKIRLPLSGNSLLRTFELTDSIKQVFDYVNCFGREEFENQCGDFDLTQTFPKISLRDHLSEKIAQVFPDSDRENIIVKQF